MQEKTTTDWADTSTAKIECNKTAHAHNQYQQTKY